MQKRRLKVNILDLTIVILIICAALAIAFRENISEFFTKPVINPIEITVTAQAEDEQVRSAFVSGSTVTLKSNDQIQAVIKTVYTSEGYLNATLVCNGYKKLGRYYTEKGDLLSEGEVFNLLYGDISISCSVNSAEIME